MRTVNVLLDAEMYEQFTRLTKRETGAENISKIMNEIVSLGMKQYPKRNFRSDEGSQDCFKLI